MSPAGFRDVSLTPETPEPTGAPSASAPYSPKKKGLVDRWA